MALLAHLGENFLHASICFCHEQGAARAIARAEAAEPLARHRVGGEEASIASSHPFPSGAPQAVYGTTAISSTATAASAAATATTAAAPPHCRRLVGRHFGMVAWGSLLGPQLLVLGIQRLILGALAASYRCRVPWARSRALSCAFNAIDFGSTVILCCVACTRLGSY